MQQDPSRLGRAALSLFLVYHLLTMAVSAARDLGGEKGPIARVQETLSVVTRPYERGVGVHQNWTMFVPNAPTRTTWLEAEGTRGATKVPLALPAGRPDADGFTWTYSRAAKFERTADDDRPLEESLVRHLCREAVASGARLDTVTLQRAWVRTPPPDERATAPRADWPVERKRLGSWNCSK